MLDSDIFYFPFLSSVWGSVSDWALVTVTGVTLWYLIKTFKSQNEVQRLQLKATQIENSRFIKEEDLRFDLELIKSSIHKVGDDIILHIFNIKSTLKNGNCNNYDLNITSENGDLEFTPNSITEMNRVTKNSQAIIQFQFKMNSQQLANGNGIIDIQIDFSDEVNNRLKQTAKLIIVKGGHQFIIEDVIDVISI